jgi:flagellar biosynthetic protein FliQ
MEKRRRDARASAIRSPRHVEVALRHSGKGVWEMDVGQASDLVRETLMLALVIAAPLLLIGLGVGLIISLFQAVTQIQEQTLVFVPKIVAMVAAAMFVMPWIANRLMEYTAAMFSGGL